VTSQPLTHTQQTALGGSSVLSRVITAWLFTAVSDWLFSSVLTVFIYKRTFASLWQGVASTLLGPSASQRGTTATVIGILMHFGVALGWTTVFFLLLGRLKWLRDLVRSRFGVLKAASIYGPFIWLVMSLAVIPLLLHRPPSITVRWWVQFFGHIPFVALPMIATLARGLPARDE
jgi:hypothetical protein